MPIDAVLCAVAAVAHVLFAALVFRLRAPLLRKSLVFVGVTGSVLHAGYAGSRLPQVDSSNWLRVAFFAGVLQAGALTAFSRSSLARWSRGETPFGRGSRVLVASLSLAGASVWLLPQSLELVHRPLDELQVTLTAVGQLGLAGWLLGLLFALAGLEQLLRRAREPLRYQLKFLLLGLAGLAVVQVYTISLFLLEGAWQPRVGPAHSGAGLLSLILTSVAIGRLRKGDGWRPLAAPGAGYGSISLAVVGTYLLAMGLAAAALPDDSSHFVLGVAVTSAAALAVAVLLASRFVRNSLVRFLTRTFKRSKYDYRAKWLEVSELFHGTASVDEILDRLIEWLATSFRAPRLSIWMQTEADGRFRQVRTVNTEPPFEPLAPSHALVLELSHSPKVLCIDAARWGDEPFYSATHLRLAAPLWTGELIGFVALGGGRAESAYQQDDVDLLQAACNHASALLAHAKLSEQQRADAQVKALYEFSMFCVHDLKNLAGRLSLVAQNAKRFRDNPEFQVSALKTVATTVERMTALIGKLSARSRLGSELDAPNHGVGSADFFRALADAGATLKPGVRLRLPEVPAVRPCVALSEEVLTQLLLNVLTNAEHAVDDAGEIRVLVDDLNTELLVTVCDTGCGMSPAALAKVFQPFNSGKEHGLGVGLYQCKSSIERAGGRMLVESQLGEGTTVRLYLPVASTSDAGSAA